MRTAARRRRVHGRVPDLSHVPECQGIPHLRRQLRGHAGDHRAFPRAGPAEEAAGGGIFPECGIVKVAFIGLGVMGYPMAGHLAASGHEVTVYNRTAAKADAWCMEHKGRKAASPA